MATVRAGRCGRTTLAGLAFALAGTTSALAQVPPEPRIHLSLGGLWASGTPFGSSEARLTPNQSGGGPYVLFKTESELEPALGLEARLTYDFTRTFGLEAGVRWTTSHLSTRVTGDLESAAAQTAAVGVSEYAVDAAAVIRLRRLAPKSGHVAPFLTAGAGYLRQAYEDNVLVESGTAYHAGGGVLLWFGPPQRQWLKRMGLRTDVRWTYQDGGILLGDRTSRSLATVTAAAALQF